MQRTDVYGRMEDVGEMLAKSRRYRELAASAAELRNRQLEREALVGARAWEHSAYQAAKGAACGAARGEGLEDLASLLERDVKPCADALAGASRAVLDSIELLSELRGLRPMPAWAS